MLAGMPRILPVVLASRILQPGPVGIAVIAVAVMSPMWAVGTVGETAEHS